MENTILILIALSTCIAIALHGGNFFGKGYIMAAHAIFVMAATGFMSLRLIGALVTILPLLIIWYGFRNTPLVRAEQNAMQKPTHDNLMHILSANFVLACLVTIACDAVFVIHKEWALSFYSVALVAASFAPYFAIKTLFNFETAFGLGMRVSLDKKLNKRRAIEAGKPLADRKQVTADGLFDLRRCIELTAGLLPCGLALAFMCKTISVLF